MKGARILFLLCLLSWRGIGTGARYQSASTDSAQDQKCTIEGVVTSATTGQPVEGAWVILEGYGSEGGSSPASGVHTVLTDGQGRFEIRNVPQNFSGLSVGKDGYVSWGLDGTKNPLQPLTRLTIRLMPWAVVSGRVTDAQGQPLVSARVQAPMVHYSDSGSVITSNWRGFYTDDRGDYRIYGLSPGRYFVVVSYAFGATPRGGFTPQALRGLNSASAKAYPADVIYPGTRQISKAKEIILAPGQEISGIDFRLSVQRAYQISGKLTGVVTSQVTSPPPRIYMTVRGNGNLNLSFWPAVSGWVGPDGQFLMRNVLPGLYDLWAEQDLPNDRTVAKLPVEVRNSDISGLVVKLGHGANIHLRITVEGPPIAQDYVSVVLLAADEFGMSTWVRKEGSQASPGLYQVFVQGLPRTAYIKSAYLGARDILTKPARILACQAPASLNVVIAQDGGELTGTVSGNEGKPDPRALVVLVPPAALRDFRNLYKAEATDSSGHFTLEGIRPGNYSIFAWDRAEAWSWFDPQFLKAMEGRGTPLEVTAGEHKTLQLRSILVPPSLGGRP